MKIWNNSTNIDVSNCRGCLIIKGVSCAIEPLEDQFTGTELLFSEYFSWKKIWFYVQSMEFLPPTGVDGWVCWCRPNQPPKLVFWTARGVKYQNSRRHHDTTKRSKLGGWNFKAVFRNIPIPGKKESILTIPLWKLTGGRGVHFEFTPDLVYQSKAPEKGRLQKGKIFFTAPCLRNGLVQPHPLLLLAENPPCFGF